MKRSEMETLLKNWIDNEVWWKDYDSQIAIDFPKEILDKLATFLLHEIEEAGMLPPPRYIEPFYRYDVSWEPEDD